jgi:glycerol-3-phosphate acyltransferase PlsX
MAGSTLKLRTIEGVLRPALASIIPTRNRPFVLIDVGANPVADGHYLIHNAILGAHFAQAVLPEAKPRVGLLTIGTEEGKGNASIQVAHDILKQCACETWDYAGLIEGFDVFNNRVDVVVCDGFVGNILLKVCEALFGHLKDYLKEEFQKTWERKAGAWLCRGVFDAMKRQFSPDQFSGAPLLGLNGWVFKSHGSSKATAIEGALHICTKCLSVCDLQSVKTDIAAVNALLSTESIAR